MAENGIILLVEDNPKILDLNRRMLEQEGCMVLTAATLAEARQRLKIASPDVAVLDIMLPDGSGLEFFDELRAISSAPVLFLTAKADREDIIAGFTAGGNDYITKPYDIDEFRMRVKGFLRLVGENREKRGLARKGTYLPERLIGMLDGIHSFPLTTIVAPAGYGKTTAARVFCDGLPPECDVFYLNAISGSGSEFWRDFSWIFADKFHDFSESLITLGIPDDLDKQRKFLRLVNGMRKDNTRDVYLIVDDFHTVTNPALQSFLLFVSRNLPDGIHIVILSRTPVFEQNGRFLLSGRVNEIIERDLLYGPKETKDYFALCGCPISDEDAARLSETTEGWIAALYLSMRSYAETGCFSHTKDIHSLAEAALFHPLSEREKELLTALSFFPSFSSSQAVLVSGMKDAEKMLLTLMKNNSFITLQEPGGMYRLHQLFADVVRGAFEKLPEQQKRHYTRQAGLAYWEDEQWICAARMFYSAGDFHYLMLALEQDSGASLCNEMQSEFLAWFDDCPEDILDFHPLAVLIYALCLFLLHKRPECEAALGMLRHILEKNISILAEEHDNLLGEAQVVESFLGYNDVAAMTACYRRACDLMDRPTRLASLMVPWTYGSPSVFAAYHRKSGEADRENELMKKAMFYWYRLSQNHGGGAEHLFEGELCFLRGNFTDAIISLHRALHDAHQNHQTIMAIAADFLRLRIETFQGNYESVEAAIQAMRVMIDKDRPDPLRDTVNLCETWIYSLADQPCKAAEWIAEGNLNRTRIMFPGVHFLHMVYCQLLLAQGEYAALIAREGDERAMHRIYPTMLCEIYLDVQLAAAYEQLGKRGAAIEHLMRALEAAAPDHLFMPFAENGNYIIDPLREVPKDLWGHAIEKILALYLQNRTRQKVTIWDPCIAAALGELSERELSIARFAASGMSNKEIAAELYLSESRVKSYLSGIFQKLGIADKKNKRNMLSKFFGPVGSMSE